MGYARRVTLFDGSSGQSSTYTSDWHLVPDYERVTVSWHTDTGTASRLSLEGSLEDGLSSSIVSTSNISAVVVAGQYSVDANLRWLRAARGSEESLAIVHLQLRT